MKKLLIVESPAKVKTIGKFLGSDFKIVSTVGHIKDLPKRELGVTMNGSIEITYIPLEKKEKVIREICKEAARADEVFLAPDPDREGEIIAWHVEQEIKKHAGRKTPIYRIAFNEITKPAIEEALAHPSSIDVHKVAAQQARRILDRWVGYQVSPILWRKVSKGLSAGRVQSVALRLICQREEEILAFKPEEYWTIDGLFNLKKGTLAAALTHKKDKKIVIPNQQEVDKILKEIRALGDPFTLVSIKDTKRLKNPTPPFMTSTLQQAAYNQLGFSVDKTMMLAQQLYEGVPLDDASTPVALITYMRTDSLRVADTALKGLRDYIRKEYGTDYLPPQEVQYARKEGQDAHEAVRPISVTLDPEKVGQYLSRDLARLYELIWKRFVASQMKAALYAQKQLTIEGGDYTFKATGSTLIFDGFLRVYNDGDEKEDEKKVVLPADLQENMKLPLAQLNPKQHFTEPPPRYTQASLVKELEKEGIGRPSTYASILKTIQARAYTNLDNKKRFVPTELGILVTRLLVEHLPKIMNIKFTAHMEQDLDAIAQGSLERDKLLREFYTDFEKDVTAFAGQQKGKAREVTHITCPLCKEGTLVVRFGKAGPFVGCDKFPACTFTSKFMRGEDGKVVLVETEQPKLLDRNCPLCSKPLRQVVGKYGPFVACSGYPECKYIEQKVAPFACPLCGSKVVQRTARGRAFWGCSSYPKCTFTAALDSEHDGQVVTTPKTEKGTSQKKPRTKKKATKK